MILYITCSKVASLAVIIIQVNQPNEHVKFRMKSMGGSRGGTGGLDPPPPLKNQKNIGFPSNIDQDLIKITKLLSQHSMVGHYRHANDDPLLVAFRSSFHPISNKTSVLDPL